MIFKEDSPKNSDGQKLIRFAEPSDKPKKVISGEPWKILVIDDEEEVFSVTRMALQDLTLDGRPLIFIPAFSEKEARQRLAEHDNIALILLDVVMEEDDSGLKLVEYIRKDLHNNFVRIILRTGQPGEAPEKRVILDYDINDYKEKTEMTSQKLSTTVISALRSYRDIMTIQRLYRELEENNKQLEAKNKSLAQEITVRKKAEEETKRAQETALKHAAAAGKAQFATSVLHNIGNVLNSVQVSSTTLYSKVSSSNSSKFFKAIELLQDHMDDTETFFTKNPKGKILPEYLVKVGHSMKREFEDMESETSEMLNRVQLMKDIIETQQTHAKAELVSSTLDLDKIIEEALKVMEDKIAANNIEVVQDFNVASAILGQESKLTHVVINIIKNAIEAMNNSEKRRLILKAYETVDSKVCLEISDSGMGISSEHADKMFTHGFTTKKDGHGFGLHFCHNAMTEMGGSISCSSEGIGHGATFRLVFLSPGDFEPID